MQFIQHLRRLRAQPGFTLTAVISLALGIGAATALWSILDAVLYRPFPVRDPDRLFALYMHSQRGFPYTFASYPDIVDLAARTEAVEAMAYWMNVDATLYDGSRAERIGAQMVSGNYFDTIGVRPVEGRAFTALERDAVAVASAEFCTGCVGRAVIVNGQPFTIIGVAPPAFRGLNLQFRPKLWIPVSQFGVMVSFLAPRRAFLERQFRMFAVTGRLRGGVSLEQANLALAATARTLAERFPATNGELSVHLMPLGEARVLPGAMGGIRGLLLLIGGLVACALLMMCGNVASLLLVRATVREREFAVRAALGASRARLTGQIAIECLLLVLAGALGGGSICAAILEAVRSRPDLLPLGFAIDPRMDWRLLSFSISLSGAITVVCGLLPGYFAAGRDPARAALASRGSSRVQIRLRGGLVAAQVALCFVLLAGAALFFASSKKLLAADTGFRAGNVLMLGFDLPRNVYDTARTHSFLRRLLERVRALPGVTAVSLANSRPLERVQAASKVIVDGKQVSVGGLDWISGNIVTPDYFRTVGVDIVRGRGFTERDGTGAVVVSEEFARRFLPGREPVGAAIRYSHESTAREVVGVARDATYRSPGDPPQPYHYQPWNQDGHGSLMVRTVGSARASLPAIEREARTLDAQVPLLDVSTLEENKLEATAQVRTAAWIAGAFGALSLVLAVAGIHGVIAFSVARRRQEIGVRMAVGARGQDVARGVVMHAVKLAITGAVAGAAACVALGSAARPFLSGVSAWSPAVLAPVSLLLAVAAAGAALWPAVLASRVDPVEALRRE